jgi:hypothetical protein
VATTGEHAHIVFDSLNASVGGEPSAASVPAR